MLLIMFDVMTSREKKGVGIVWVYVVYSVGLCKSCGSSVVQRRVVWCRARECRYGREQRTRG